MSRIARYRPTPGTVIATLALFLAMGGVSYGLAGRNGVRADDIASGAVGKSEIRTRGVGKSEIRTGAVGKSEAGRDSVGPNEAREDSDSGGGFTGAQIRESTLGKVPSADTLDDLDSSAFVRGGAVSNVLTVADNAASGRILTLPGLAVLDVGACDDDEAGGDDGLTIRLTNVSGATLQFVEGFYNSGDVASGALAAGGSRTSAAPLDAQPNGRDIVNLALVGTKGQAEVDIGIDLSGAGCQAVARGLVMSG